jgi:hypothetical protein
LREQGAPVGKENPAPAVVGLIPAVAVVFVTGYLRGVRAELRADRVTFLSPEEERRPQRARNPSGAQASVSVRS